MITKFCTFAHCSPQHVLLPYFLFQSFLNVLQLVLFLHFTNTFFWLKLTERNVFLPLPCKNLPNNCVYYLDEVNFLGDCRCTSFLQKFSRFCKFICFCGYFHEAALLVRVNIRFLKTFLLIIRLFVLKNNKKCNFKMLEFILERIIVFWKVWGFYQRKGYI